MYRHVFIGYGKHLNLFRHYLFISVLSQSIWDLKMHLFIKRLYFFLFSCQKHLFEI